jgi:hypothetical protein
VIKVEDLAWLEFEKPDLDAAERFAHDFGFATAYRGDTEVHLRGTLAGTHGVVIRKGRTSRFLGPAFRASSRADLKRLARATGASVRERGRDGGAAVHLHDPRRRHARPARHRLPGTGTLAGGLSAAPRGPLRRRVPRLRRAPHHRPGKCAVHEMRDLTEVTHSASASSTRLTQTQRPLERSSRKTIAR